MSGGSTRYPKFATHSVRNSASKAAISNLPPALCAPLGTRHSPNLFIEDAGFKRVKIWWTDINDEEDTEFKEYEEAPMTQNWLAYFAAYD